MYKVPSSTGDGRALAPAWSPLSWLRIVYGVWIDQRWYWSVIRPRLRGWRQGWPIVAQSYAGSALCALALLLPPLAIWRQLDVPVDVDVLFFRVLVLPMLVLFMLLPLLLGYFKRVSFGVSSSATIIMAFTVMMSLVASIAMVVYTQVPPPPDPLLPARPPHGLDLSKVVTRSLNAVVGLVIGMDGVEQGSYEWPKRRPLRIVRMPRAPLIFGALWVVLVVLMGVAMVLGDFEYRHMPGRGAWWPVQLIANFGAMLVGMLFAASLVARQIPDPEERRRLANPDEGPWDGRLSTD